MQTFVPKNTAPVQAIKLKYGHTAAVGDYLVIDGDKVEVYSESAFLSQYAPQQGQAEHKDGKRRTSTRDPVDQRLSVYRALGNSTLSEDGIRDRIPESLTNVRRRLRITLGTMVDMGQLAMAPSAGGEAERTLYVVSTRGQEHKALLEHNDARRVARSGISGAR